MKRALDLGSALLVYPGGDHETYRPTWESDKIDFAERTGFIKLALEHGTPIVPVVAIGGQETALFLGQGRDLAKILQLERLRAEGAAGPDRPALRPDLPGPAGPPAAARQDHRPGAPPHRPEGDASAPSPR